MLWSAVTLRPDQSNPMILIVAVGLLPRILYCIFTDFRRPLRPGASFGAVCPPAFPVPTAVSLSSARLEELKQKHGVSDRKDIMTIADAIDLDEKRKS